uniref:Metallo-beta-lactamase domain containing 2 n=1 Tax=Malurus cyaneus samueli TaxID=2593467 RepID=A0A8C5XA11_9PASS
MSALGVVSRTAPGRGSFWIDERFYESGNRANIWLGAGLPDYLRARAVGAGRGRQAAGRYWPWPPTLHFDHSGGLSTSRTGGRTCAQRRSSPALSARRQLQSVSGCRTGDRWRGRLRPAGARRQFRVNPVINLFAGDVINLGDHQLTVMHMPGHSRGSICLHDKDRKILFSGDVVYDGSMIDWLPYSRISDYVASCQRLMDLVDRGLVEKVLPGHFNIFGAERLYQLASNYISQAGFCHKISTCVMRSIASVALRVTNSRITSQ